MLLGFVSSTALVLRPRGRKGTQAELFTKWTVLHPVGCVNFRHASSVSRWDATELKGLEGLIVTDNTTSFCEGSLGWVGDN